VERAIAVLEFSAVQAAVAERASTNMGRELALVLQPSTDQKRVTVMLEQLEDALYGASLHLGGITDVRATVAKLEDGAMVSGSDLLEIAYTLDSAMTLKRGIAQHSLGPLLEVAQGIGQHVVLTRSVLERLDRDGSVRDDASPKLRQLRRRLAPLRNTIRERLTGIMERAGDALQEKIITIRRDRYVIPVKSSFENQVSGIVVDSSASNQTVFIEPASVVPLNNELARVLIEEEQEVARILLELARLVHDEPGLWETLRVVAELDLIGAKAALCRDWELNRASISATGDFELRGLQHPLIPNCVPNDVVLNAERRVLLITGPNMGGKTVTMKSLGLATLMHQSGLFVRADIAKLPVVSDVLVDMGDEQSILESLSTFAAHLRNLHEILDEATPNTLMLIDELGSGTDPAEGAALAQAILEQLLQQGARGIVTSHLAPLKVFAFERTDIQNASMGFEVDALRPTYKLNVGQPGRSYALAIAQRLGLPQAILERAATVLGPQGANVEKLLENLERERANLEADALAARKARAQSEREEKELRAKLEAFEAQQAQLLVNAQAKADGVYRDAMEQVRQLKSRAREDTVERPKVMNELRELRVSAQAARPETSATQREPDSLKPGSSVEVPAYGTTGTILEVRGNDEVLVQMGLLKVTLKRRDVKMKKQNGVGVKVSGGGYVAPRTFAKELNLRGSHVEEAIEEIRNFIAEAQALRESPIRILHGKGEGVLRRVVRDYLKSDKRVESFHDAQPFEGGHGVTVAHVRV
jgi:DNA mismatch repair protein MutS2